MTAVSVDHLKPLGMGQILDRAFRLYRQNFAQFIGIIAISQIPLIAINTAISFFAADFDPFGFDPANPETITDSAGLFVVGFLAAIVSVLFTQIGTAALTRAVSDNYLGSRVGILDAYKNIGSSWLSLIGALIFSFLLMMAVFLLFLIPCIGWLLAIPGVGFFSFYGIVLIPLIAPVIVLERKRAIESIGRAWNLARRRFWWMFGFMLLLTILSTLIVSGPALLLQLLLTSVVSSLGDTVSIILQQLASSLLSIVFLPLQLTAVTLLYFDNRIRFEGFDLAVLAKSTELEQQSVDDLTVDVPTSRTKLSPSGTELGYFALITIGVVAIVFALGSIMTLIIAALSPALGGL